MDDAMFNNGRVLQGEIRRELNCDCVIIKKGPASEVMVIVMSKIGGKNSVWSFLFADIANR